MDKFMESRGKTTAPLILFAAALVCISNSAHTQQNLRAWHTQGQTFLVWEHSGSVLEDATYNIYSSSDSITSISGATWIGRVFANNGANSRLDTYVPDARWVLPDTLGAATRVDTNEAYFAVTSHSAGIMYYAVVTSGDTVVTSDNTAGPVEETIDPVGVVIQHQDTAVTIYGHWIDGSAAYDSGRSVYPIMGNECSNGIGFNFAVWEPEGGRPAGNMPLVVALHGGSGNLFGFAPHGIWGSYTKFSEGLFVTLDDAFIAKDPLDTTKTITVNTFWLGYANEFNRFSPSFPSDSAIVVSYTARRVWWEIEWLLNNLPLDENSVSVTGLSMGGYGTLFHTQVRPDIFSAGLSFVPPLSILNVPQSILEQFSPLLGTVSQNLHTNFESEPGVYDISSQTWRLQHQQEDWPFTLIVSGKKDNTCPWWEKPDVYRQLDSAKTGFASYWDNRTHVFWWLQHWQKSEHIHASYLARFRKNQSFPAFSGTDLDILTPGRQPDPGNGDPEDGDTWGTWGGYLEWDTGSIVDTASKWAVTVWVVHESIYLNDIPDADTILADVTPRRLQQFEPQPGHSYSWSLTRVSNGDTLQEGTVQADSSGVILVTDLLLIKEKTRLTISGPVGIEESCQSTVHSLQFTACPNPFTHNTVVEFVVRSWEFVDQKPVSLQIYDLSGRVVRSFQISKSPNHQIAKSSWDGTDDSGKRVSTGVYFCKLEAGNSKILKKLVLLR